MGLAFAGRLLQGLNASAPSLSSKGRCSLRMAGPAMPGDCPGGQAASLDRSVFAQQWRVFALRVPPKLTQGTVKALKDHVLRVPRVAAVSKAGGVESDRFVLLRYFAAPPPDVPFSPRGNMEMSLIGDSAAVVEKLRVEKFSGKVSEEVERLVREVSEASLVDTVVELGYEHWSIESVLGRLLPAGTTIPSAYESVGHIAHVNLRFEHQPHKAIIANVLLDKLKPRVRTVVNKTESTGGPYRTFGMEVLAGDPSLETSLRENGCTFTLDFAKVYWNSRLETEHRRVVDSLAEGDVLADAFCGIGPFVIPASRMHKCKVYANDLNPSSVEYLKRNAAKNRIPTGAGGDFQVSCGCARDFLRRLVRDERVPITRVVMNFPSGAPEFLDVFAGLYAGLEDDEMPMPKVNCYCFARGDEWKNETTMRVRAALGLGGGDVLDVDVREVRDVAPNKLHVCATFVVPEHVAYGRTGGTPAAPDAAVGGGAASAPEAKRQRV